MLPYGGALDGTPIKLDERGTEGEDDYSFDLLIHGEEDAEERQQVANWES